MWPITFLILIKHILYLNKSRFEAWLILLCILARQNIAKAFKAGLYDETFLHRWLNFSFDSFLSTFNTCIQLRNVNEIFESTIMKVFQKKKILTRFLIKIFSSEMYFTNQRSNLYRKWRKWLHEVNTKEEMNENLKTYISKENREKIRATRQIIKIKLESCGNG